MTALLASAMIAAAPLHAANAEARFFAALAAVEGKHGTSDHRTAKGPFQIHHAYWANACKQTPLLIPFGWKACNGPVYSRAVVRAYLRRFAPLNWREQNWEFLARVHHCGLHGARKGRGKAFAQRVVNLINDPTCKPLSARPVGHSVERCGVTHAYTIPSMPARRYDRGATLTGTAPQGPGC